MSRLYYTDPYLTSFDATVVDLVDVGGRPALVLDRTAFYPTSGGQPFDVGVLNDICVTEVVDLEDGRIAHVVDRPVAPGSPVHGRLDWDRRFDHMQQHTGQHVLSSAFARVHAARTESFHLGSAVSAIDLSAVLDAGQVAAAEAAANRVVWEDRPVSVRFVDAEQAASLPLRKDPTRSGTIRLVEVEDVDLSACGGTHVSRTGAIGVIAVSGFERFKGTTRVEFLCGGRALARFGQLRDIVAGSVRQLSVLPHELPAAIERLQTELRSERAVQRALQGRLVGHEAAALAEGAIDAGGVLLVGAVVDGFDAQGLKALGVAVAARPRHVAVLIGTDATRPIVIARAPDVALDASAMLRALTARFGGKGGGRPELAQGGGLTGSADVVLAGARALVDGALE